MGDIVHDVHELIERINASERLRGSSHFSSAVYRNEPIITTGRQMAGYLPERYREMRKISRWQEGSPRGRWLSEAELFYRQALFMEDFEDDCPYHGAFDSYYPTYNAMSDRQLRGYFTWRAAVRRGDIQEGPLAYAYVYLYELINGVGVTDALDGFRKLDGFWRAYREIAPGIDRYARTWLRDYVVYHGLDPVLLGECADITFDRELLELVSQSAPFDPDLLENIDIIVANDDDEVEAISLDASWAQVGEESQQGGSTGRGRRSQASALPLPADAAHEAALLAAIDALSSYRIRLSRLYKDAPDDLRHVACAVYVRLLRYYRRHRRSGFVETLFGEELNMSYTMFSSAVFFEPRQHPSVDYRLDAIHWYQCRRGTWRCIRVYGAREKSPVLGKIMRAVDRKLRDALGYPHPLKEQNLPKYLNELIDKEVAAWTAWKADHARRAVEIDLSQLAGIRSAAAWARDALLTDEERGEAGAMEEVATTGPAAPQSAGEKKQEQDAQKAVSCSIPPADAESAAVGGKGGADRTAAPDTGPAAALDVAERAYLAALLAGEPAPLPAGTSEDLFVDAINDRLFDLVGDTVVEFGADSPHIIEDYEDDVREVLNA
ncbi:TerB N-terminal domain-containing protein [Enorma burkinafasonensis]|uniref:TerB N-terminal domain-containing protein n=1 Tax=Enorma burkinafasonensis TaxID=2590867 RepID=UPI0026F2BE41|nr:TerB N-terminal domain-containing protein [Enorma burkinafasonensis]MCI7729835.1 TerB N-terminal domain-containing protein [Enorma burkinafasonensis]